MRSKSHPPNLLTFLNNGVSRELDQTCGLRIRLLLEILQLPWEKDDVATTETFVTAPSFAEEPFAETLGIDLVMESFSSVMCSALLLQGFDPELPISIRRGLEYVDVARILRFDETEAIRGALVSLTRVELIRKRVDDCTEDRDPFLGDDGR